jgi:hypothetical protein
MKVGTPYHGTRHPHMLGRGHAFTDLKQQCRDLKDGPRQLGLGSAVVRRLVRCRMEISRMTRRAAMHAFGC